jgi:hypothetical protein
MKNPVQNAGFFVFGSRGFSFASFIKRTLWPRLNFKIRSQFNRNKILFGLIEIPTFPLPQRYCVAQSILYFAFLI